MLQEQRQRSKDSSKVVDMTAMDALRQRLGQLNATQFSGYHGTSGQGAVVAIVRDGESVDSAEEGGWHCLSLPPPQVLCCGTWCPMLAVICLQHRY